MSSRKSRGPQRRSGVERRTVDIEPKVIGKRDRRSGEERRSGTDRRSEDEEMEAIRATDRERAGK